MAKRQEQEEARPEVTEVAPNVLRMQLPIQMPGLGHVNCYALVDGEGAAVVDPGLPGTASWRALQDRLKQAGIRLKHVHTVIVTHSHPEHLGGEKPASESQAEKPAQPAPPGNRALGTWGGPTPWGGTRPRPPFKQR